MNEQMYIRCGGEPEHHGPAAAPAIVCFIILDVRYYLLPSYVSTSLYKIIRKQQ